MNALFKKERLVNAATEKKKFWCQTDATNSFICHDAFSLWVKKHLPEILTPGS